MQPALTITHLFPPIAAATIVTAVLFAYGWRAHQIELKTGKEPWWLGPGIVVYGIGVALFVYLRARLPAQGADLFGAALVGEAGGVLITFALVQAFVVMRGRPWRERAFPAVAGVFLTGLAFAGFLTGR